MAQTVRNTYISVSDRPCRLPLPPLVGATARSPAILGALDDKIDLNRRMNETLEAMARAIFKDWFVDFGPTRAKMEGRAPYLAPEIWALFPDRLDDEGKPEGWTTDSLGDIASRLRSNGIASRSDAATTGRRASLGRREDRRSEIGDTPEHEFADARSRTSTDKRRDDSVSMDGAARVIERASAFVAMADHDMSAINQDVIAVCSHAVEHASLTLLTSSQLSTGYATRATRFDDSETTSTSRIDLRADRRHRRTAMSVSMNLSDRYSTESWRMIERIALSLPLAICFFPS